MQLTPSFAAASQTAQASTPPSRSNWRGLDLGSITHDHRTGASGKAETDFLIGTGELFGLRSGFANPDDAIIAARYASKGSLPAVAILQGSDHNFHLRGVRNLSVSRLFGQVRAGDAGKYGVGHRFEPYHLERHALVDPGNGSALRPGMGYPRYELQAIVDGTIVHNAWPQQKPPTALRDARP